MQALRTSHPCNGIRVIAAVLIAFVLGVWAGYARADHLPEINMPVAECPAVAAFAAVVLTERDLFPMKTWMQVASDLKLGKERLPASEATKAVARDFVQRVFVDDLREPISKQETLGVQITATCRKRDGNYHPTYEKYVVTNVSAG